MTITSQKSRLCKKKGLIKNFFKKPLQVIFPSMIQTSPNEAY